MNRLVAFLVLVLSVCALPARAALVYDGYPTGPGGLSTPYPAVNPEVYAGYIQMNLNGVPVLAMSDDYNARSNVGESWPMTLYTYADVMAGAPVRFSPDRYSEVGFWFNGDIWSIFGHISFPGYSGSTSLAGELSSAAAYDPSFPGYLADVNQGVWQVMNPSLSLSSWSGCLIPDSLTCEAALTTDWSWAFVIASGGPGRDEYLIPLYGQNITLASGTIGPIVPLPPAFWLLGSGLLGLVGVARKRHSAPH